MATRGKTHLGLVEDALKIDARDLRHLGVFRTGAFGQLTWDLTWGQGQSQLAEANYWTTETELILDFKDNDRSFRQSARIVQQDCHLGGFRRWLLCPYRGSVGVCFRRVRCLYLPAWANEFGCRNCHRLIHRSAHEHDARVDRLRKNIDLLEATVNDQSGTLSANLRRQRLATKALQRGYCRPNLPRG